MAITSGVTKVLSHGGKLR